MRKAVLASERPSCFSFSRPYVEPSLLKVWKALFSHLVNVVANNVMNAKETGDVFGSLLLRQESTWSNQVHLLFICLVERCLEGGCLHCFLIGLKVFASLLDACEASRDLIRRSNFTALGAAGDVLSEWFVLTPCSLLRFKVISKIP